MHQRMNHPTPPLPIKKSFGPICFTFPSPRARVRVCDQACVCACARVCVCARVLNRAGGEGFVSRAGVRIIIHHLGVFKKLIKGPSPRVINVFVLRYLFCKSKECCTAVVAAASLPLLQYPSNRLAASRCRDRPSPYPMGREKDLAINTFQCGSVLMPV